jgi:hypothetical protein
MKQYTPRHTTSLHLNVGLRIGRIGLGRRVLRILPSISRCAVATTRIARPVSLPITATVVCARARATQDCAVVSSQRNGRHSKRSGGVLIVGWRRRRGSVVDGSRRGRVRCGIGRVVIVIVVRGRRRRRRWRVVVRIRWRRCVGVGRRKVVLVSSGITGRRDPDGVIIRPLPGVSCESLVSRWRHAFALHTHTHTRHGQATCKEWVGRVWYLAHHRRRVERHRRPRVARWWVIWGKKTFNK